MTDFTDQYQVRLDESAQRQIVTAEGLEEVDEWSQWTVDCHADVARMFRNVESACIELSRLPAEQTRSLTGMFQAVLALRTRCLDDARKMIDEYDPSYYCTACHTREPSRCQCDRNHDPMD